MTDQDEVLKKMHEWVLAEIEKAKLPGQDPFTMTSLTYCASKAAGGDAMDSVRDRLWEACREMAHKTFHVFTPEQAIGVIEWATDRIEVY